MDIAEFLREGLAGARNRGLPRIVHAHEAGLDPQEHIASVADAVVAPDRPLGNGQAQRRSFVISRWCMRDDGADLVPELSEAGPSPPPPRRRKP